MEHDWKTQKPPRRSGGYRKPRPCLFRCVKCGTWKGVGVGGSNTVVADPPENCKENIPREE